MRAPRMSIGLGSFLVALALVIAVGIGSAIAVIPNNGTYSACLTKATGEIRVVNYPKVKCAKGERLLRWNAKGPVGPQGPQGAGGPQGPQGPQGPAGPADWNAIPNIPAGFADGVDNDGVTSVKIRTVTSTTPGITGVLSEGNVATDDADCPSGFLTVGGGYRLSGFLTDLYDLSVWYSQAIDADTWRVRASKPAGGNEVEVYAQVHCLRAEPAGIVIAAKNSNYGPKKAKVRLPHK